MDLRERGAIPGRRISGRILIPSPDLPKGTRALLCDQRPSSHQRSGSKKQQTHARSIAHQGSAEARDAADQEHSSAALVPGTEHAFHRPQSRSGVRQCARGAAPGPRQPGYAGRCRRRRTTRHWGGSFTNSGTQRTPISLGFASSTNYNSCSEMLVSLEHERNASGGGLGIGAGSD